MKAYQDSFVEFTVDDIKKTAEFEIVVRYESTSANWEDVTITIIRPDAIDRNGLCAGTHPSDDIKRIVLPSNTRSVVAFPPACLEAGKVYKIRIDFRGENISSSGATVLIDSVSSFYLHILYVYKKNSLFL